MNSLTYEEMLKMNDIQKKMKVAKTVVMACRTDKEANISYLTKTTNSISIGNSVRYYTGLDLKIIFTYLKEYLNKPYSIGTVSALCQKYYQYNAIYGNKWNTNIRECIFAHYFKGMKVPTISLLRCRSDIFRKVSEDDKVVYMLEMNDYIQQRVEGTSKAIIIEKPQKTIERFRYLEAMKRYRSSGLNIVYINYNKLEPPRKYSWDYIAVSPKVGVLGTYKLNEESQLNKITEVEDWILQHILPLLLSPSVIVLDDNIVTEDFFSMPIMCSSKTDMIEWLTVNNISHRSNMHRAELYEIIKRSKRHTPDKIYKFDNMVNARGHKVLRQPKGIDCLNYLEMIWLKLVFAHKTSLETIKKCAEGLLTRSVEEWEELENKLVQVENYIYREDLVFEDIVDKLMTLGKYSPDSRQLFDQCDDAPDVLKLLDIIEM